LDHTISGELSNGVSGSYNHRKAVAGALEKAEYVLFHLPPGIGVGAFASARVCPYSFGMKYTVVYPEAIRAER
jgi:hypothetical protein